MKTVFELIDMFAADQDVAPNSVKLYVRNIKYFVRWVQMEKKDIDHLKMPDIIQYKKWLFHEKFSTLTIDSRITSIRKFYKWCDKNDHYNNIVIGVKNPKRYKGYKKDPLTVEQVNTLLNSIDRTTIKGKRDYAIINLMLRTAMRTVEITKLNIDDIESAYSNETHEIKYFLNIIRKGSQGNKTKIPITDKSYDPLSDYLCERVFESTPLAALFTVTSYNHKGARITTEGLSQLIKNRLRKANINSKRITAHSFRHTAAFNLIKSGAGLYDVQLFLGHSSPSITQLYTRAVEEEKRLHNTPGRLLDDIY